MRRTLILCAWVASLALPTWSLRSQPLRMHMLDVGQGDAILIETPHGRRILIDGGPDRRSISALERTLPAGTRDLELVVLTHPHADHLEGLVSILDLWRVQRVVVSGEVIRTDAVPALLSTLRDRGASVTILSKTRSASIDGVRVVFIAPKEKLLGAVTQNANDGSIVVRLEYGATRALFLGDLEAKGERALIQSGEIGPAQVLKAGHHGSRTSTTDVLLRATTPTFTLVSVGAKNRYRHPSETVIQRLAATPTTLLRTDLLGTVSLACTERSCCVLAPTEAAPAQKCIPP